LLLQGINHRCKPALSRQPWEKEVKDNHLRA
jgi:hypothetical protein